MYSRVCVGCYLLFGIAIIFHSISQHDCIVIS